MKPQYVKCADCLEGFIPHPSGEGRTQCPVCHGIGWHLQCHVKKTDKLVIKYDLQVDYSEVLADFYKCPRCGSEKIMDDFNYCPDCGQLIQVKIKEGEKV